MNALQKAFDELNNKNTNIEFTSKTEENGDLYYEYSHQTTPLVIRVYFDSDEITVCLGDYYHTRFENYIHDQLTHEKAASRAWDFMMGFINGNYYVENRFQNNKWIGSSLKYQDTVISKHIPAGVKKDNTELMISIDKWESNSENITL